MNIVIIEDEVQTAWDLQNSIQSLQPDSKVIALIDSVEAGLEWFNHNEQPDIIFSDIQLGDGLAFEILQQVQLNCPVIFCTAYEEYAIQAFQNNGIDYLLKPIQEELLKKSLDKFTLLKKPARNIDNSLLLNDLIKEITKNSKSYKSTFLVSYRDKMIPLNINDIAFFCIIDDVVELSTKISQQYRLNYSLDYVESIVDPKLFYRANRQYLIAYNAVKEVENYFDRKLLVKLHLNTEPIIVSKAKSSDLLRWLENH